MDFGQKKFFVKLIYSKSSIIGMVVSKKNLPIIEIPIIEEYITVMTTCTAQNGPKFPVIARND